VRSVTAATALAVCAGFATLVATMLCAPAPPAVYNPVELMVPTVLLPFAMPSTVQVALPPPGTVAVNCLVPPSTRGAVCGATLMVTLDTVTIAETKELVPAGPVHVKEYVVVALSAAVTREPEAARAPLQPPDAVQLAALVEVQFSVAVCPVEIIDGVAVKVAVGTAGPTLTVAEAGALTPPAPEQVNV
jgi:hypothetical protein